MNDLTNHILYNVDGRGKVKQCLEGISVAMLKGWALMNTKGKGMTIILEEETQKIIMVVMGRGNDFLKVYNKEEEIEALGIEIEMIG